MQKLVKKHGILELLHLKALLKACWGTCVVLWLNSPIFSVQETFPGIHNPSWTFTKQNTSITSWWLNQPIWKYAANARQIGSFLPGSGWKLKCLSCHHLDQTWKNGASAWKMNFLGRLPACWLDISSIIEAWKKQFSLRGYIYSNEKIHGTVATYWFILTLYQPTFWYLCHLFWP